MNHDDAVRNVRELAAQLGNRSHGVVATPAQLRFVADMADAAKGMEVAAKRARQKLQAYVGVCKGDKELTDTVLPMLEAAIASMPKEGQIERDASGIRCPWPSCPWLPTWP